MAKPSYLPPPIHGKVPPAQKKGAAARTVPPPPVKFGAQPLLMMKPPAVSGARRAPPPTRYGVAAGLPAAPLRPAARPQPRTAGASPAKPQPAPGHLRPSLAMPVRQKRLAAPTPHARQAIQPMIAIKEWFTGLPEGVDLVKFLQKGVSVGYSPKEKTVGLYRNGELIAHVEIDPQDSSGTIILHTRTDSGEAGGQGYLTVLFPHALRIVWKYFRNYHEINMAPAPGAATKGLISQLARLRPKVAGGPPTRFSAVRTDMALQYLGKADKLRESRKEAERLGLRAKPGVQDWDTASMLETAWELNALQELEFASSTGLVITGTTGKFYEQLVGSTGTPFLPGGALAWHQSGVEQNMGVVVLRIPMASVPAYINALPN